MLTARWELWNLIEPAGEPQPFTQRQTTLFETVTSEADNLLHQLRDNRERIDPNYEVSVNAIRTETKRMLLAHFGPVIVPMPMVDEPTSIEFMASICGDAVETYDIGQLPMTGPTYEPAIVHRFKDFCATFERTLGASTGFRTQIDQVIGGNRQAQATAAIYYDRFGKLARELESISLDPAAPTLGSGDEHVEYRLWSGFSTGEYLVNEAFIDDISNYQLGKMTEDLARRSKLFATVEQECGELAYPLPTVESDIALITELVAFHELPPVVTTDALCTELEEFLGQRVALRTALDRELGTDSDLAMERLDVITNRLRAPDVELPPGFEISWLEATHATERQLFAARQWDLPVAVEAFTEQLPLVESLEKWVTTNCPAITIGLYLESGLEPAPSEEAVGDARGEFCAGTDALFDARQAFRSIVPAEPGDFDETARRRWDDLLVAITSLANLIAEQTTEIDPNGASLPTSDPSLIRQEEQLVRQSLFGPYPVPVFDSWSGEETRGAALAKFALEICPNPSDSLTTTVAPAFGLGLPSMPYVDRDDPAIGDHFCSYLTAKRHAELTAFSQFERAATGDEAAARDAAAMIVTVSALRFSVDESRNARFGTPTGEQTLTDYEALYSSVHSWAHTFQDIVNGTEDRFGLNRERLQTSFVDTENRFADEVIDACPGLSPEVLNLTYDGILELHDALVDHY